MNTSSGHDLDKLVEKAQLALSKSQGLMNALAYDSDLFPEQEEDDSGDGQIRLIQLILEYRMDGQNALLSLLHLNRQLIEQLGLDPMSSYDVNLDTIAYALGRDDLHHILNSLNQLINSLSLIAQRHKRNTKQHQHPHKHAINPKYAKFSANLHKAITDQKIFISLIHDIQGFLLEFEEGKILGPIWDHIAALKGPISHFFQAIQHGLEFSYALYEKISPTHCPPQQLSHLLNQAELILNQHVPEPKPQPQEQISRTEQLEMRASIKRMGHYFG